MTATDLPSVETALVMIPPEYQPFLTAEFLGVLVLALVTPLRPWLKSHWLPVLAIAVSLLLHIAIAVHLRQDPVLLGLMAINTALVSSGIFGWAKTATATKRKPPDLG